ncbi:polysaccharide pyruvyl transferase family protein [Enterococcus faecium]|uniref:polysaccharide pyruvyl transferase family protein n=1 Tax=Enterococcus faecium TaxID=1352 RepID=UPI0015614130|nr:polysaccharide pyruvyl transferase family protein [Enterococcus faecium]
MPFYFSNLILQFAFYKIKNRNLNKKRQINFIKFTRKNIKETELLINKETKKEDLNNIDNKFDAFIIGSDQVWNYTFPRFSEFDFVTYSNRPKISYAASFGVSNIEERLKDLYRYGLTGIDYISVREEAGNKIVKDLIGVNPSVVLDPTMLLTVNEWRILTKNSELHIQQNYVVTYFLGDMTSEYSSYIENYARKKNLKIIHLGNIKDKKMWAIDPADFINLIDKAQAVFTDSFHACVFSIIFEKYFEVFERQSEMLSMNSRIDTLLKDFKIENRWNHLENDNKQEIDYSSVKKILNKRRKESLEFLDASLSKVQSSNNN